MKYMLDTNICIYAIKHKPEAVIRRFLLHDPEEMCISAVTYGDQSSTGRFSTRQNSLVLFVTRVSPSALACAAISESMGPMGIPFRSSSALIFPYSSAALAEKSNTVIGDRNREIASRFFSGAILFSTPCISSP